MKIFDLLEARPIYDLLGHKGAVTSVKFSPRGDYFASGEKERLVFVWKTNFVDCDQQQQEENEKPAKTKRPVGTPVDGTPNKTNVLKDSKIPQPSDARPVSNAMEKMNINDNKENQNGATSQTDMAKLMEANARLEAKVTTLTQTVLMMEKRLTLVEEQLSVSN